MLIDVIIPTYKPDERLLKIIEMLKSQTVMPTRVVLMNTEQKYIEHLFRGRMYEQYMKFIEVHHVSNWEFDHGKTRNQGAIGSEAEVLIYMTQDAVPKDNTLIENLIKPLLDGKAEASYARQIPYEDATLAEKFSREFNYPDTSIIKSAADIDTMGIKAFFCSNACAAYRRDVFEALGRFPVNMIFNEDMVFAHKLITSGYRIAYAAGAQVIHSHNYTNKQQFHRNFDLAVSQKMHPEAFEGISSESEGIAYAKAAFKYFKEKGKPFTFIPFAITCAYRLYGFRLGKRYESLPHRKILKYTMSPRFFKKMWS